MAKKLGGAEGKKRKATRTRAASKTDVLTIRLISKKAAGTRAKRKGAARAAASRTKVGKRRLPADVRQALLDAVESGQLQ